MAIVRRIGFTRFSRWGENLGRLDVQAANHVEGLDGTDELKITCSDDVNKGDYIVWVDWRGVAHEHIVDEPKRSHDEHGTLSTVFTSVNSIAETWDDWTDDIRPSGSASSALARALQGTRWTVGTCDVDASKSCVLYHQSVRESIAQIVETWGGELETSIVHDGTKVIARNVGIRASRGNQESPKRFTWTKDIKNITRTVSSDNPKTRVYGYGKGVETETGGYGRRLTFASVNGGKSYVEDAEATKIWGHPGANGTILPACASYINEECEDAKQLLDETKAYAAKVSQPKVSYTARVIDLYAFGRSWEGVAVGDKVAIIDKGFSEGGIRLVGRVSQIERNLINADATVTFGNLSDSMADMWQSVSQSLKGNSLRSAVYDAVAGTSANWLSQLQGAMNEQFNAAGTYHIESFELGEIWSNVPIESDTGLPVKATSNMWAININGKGFRIASGLTSSGAWNWRTFGTGKGFMADEIVAGVLRGSNITVNLNDGSVQFRKGNISSMNNSMNIDIDGGTIEMSGGGGTKTKIRPDKGISVYRNNEMLIGTVSAFGSRDALSGFMGQNCYITSGDYVIGRIRGSNFYHASSQKTTYGMIIDVFRGETVKTADIELAGADSPLYNAEVTASMTITDASFTVRSDQYSMNFQQDGLISFRNGSNNVSIIDGKMYINSRPVAMQ